jgi:hypothetical protein
VSLPDLVGLSSDDEPDSDSDDETQFLSADSDSDHESEHTYVPDYVPPIAEASDNTTMPRLTYDSDAYDSDSNSHPYLNSDSDSDDDLAADDVPLDMPDLADLSDDDDDDEPDGDTPYADVALA